MCQALISVPYIYELINSCNNLFTDEETEAQMGSATCSWFKCWSAAGYPACPVNANRATKE
jgi:hypothetical protein